MNDSCLITWNSQLALGLPGIDDDHQRLVSLINELARLRYKPLAESSLPQVFEKLRNYAATHFRSEEALMREGRISVGHFKAHCQAHAGFVAYLDRAQPLLTEEPDKILDPLLNFLTRWLVQHIAGLDAAMASELQGRSDTGVHAPTPAQPAASSIERIEALFHDSTARNIELLELNERLLYQIEETRKARQALAASETGRRLATHVFDNMAEAILVADAHMRIESTTQAFSRITGYSEDEVLGHSVFALVSQRHDRHFYRRIRSELAHAGNWSGEVWCRLKGGKTHPIWQNIGTLRGEDGQITHYIAVLSDLGEIHRVRDTAERLSWHDPLTGLANRARFMRELTQLLAQPDKQQRCTDVLLVDIDRFKIINEAHGLAAGDSLLKSIADALCGQVDEKDLVARLDSDEFAILLTRRDPDPASTTRTILRTCERIRGVLRDGITYQKGIAHLDVSIGVALFPEDRGISASDLLRQANLALHEAKIGRGSQTIIFETTMGDTARERYELEHALRLAVDHDQLRLYVQPQVNAQEQTVGIEALVRWQHPTRGLVGPDQFIPVAEHSDLIAQVDTWVLRKACALQARLAREGYILSVAINISPRHFRMPGFIPELQSILLETSADPHALVLEITEGMFIDDHTHAARRMEQLNAVGLRFSLDDFGTGYSSLAYLKRLPLHELKIDKSFIKDVTSNPGDAALVEAILAVAAVLGLGVVAEGVETGEQARFLDRASGVIRQGYYYGRPVPAENWTPAQH